VALPALGKVAEVPHDRTSWDFWTSRGRTKPNRKVAGLQRHTAAVTACAWPNCDKSTPQTFAENRIGVLCLDHAWSHYDAMNQYLVWRGVTDELEAAALVAALKARQVPLDAYTDEEFADAKAAREVGWVYYLRVGDQVKIGFSSDVRRRLRAYPPGSELLAVEPGDKKLERRRHNEFFEWLAAGREWFEPSAELLKHIQDVVDVHGDAGHYAHSYRAPARLQERKQPMKYVRSAWRV
jgi:hypothetical protein